MAIIDAKADIEKLNLTYDERKLTEDTGTDPILGKGGANQFLRGNDSPDIPRLAPDANRLGPGQHIRTVSGVVGVPTAVSPVGAPTESLEE